MPIPDTQLATWAHRSQTDSAVKAHEDIRDALRHPTKSNVWLVNFEEYLQGSYRNYTNTTHDHDVDVVIQLNTAFYYDLSPLPAQQFVACEAAIRPAQYSLQEFQPSVIDTLRRCFGWERVTMGNKAIQVAGEYGVSLDADVLICQQHRTYTSFNGDLDRGFIEGVAFIDHRRGSLVVNYPKQHLANGQEKHQASREWFKSTVRVFKNARTYMVERDLFPDKAAPSYFLQGLLYNVPNDRFGNTPRENFVDVLLWLVDHIDESPDFWCQNGLTQLFGNSPEQWNVGDAQLFLASLVKLDGEWR
jgi:hypothetical protein